MSRSFYYGSDRSMVDGAALFSRLLNEDPARYGITQERATAFAEINQTLQDAYRLVIQPSTRTPVAIALKNAAVRAMQQEAKRLGAIIAAQNNVSDADLINLGLLARPTRHRRPVPETAPQVYIEDVTGRVVDVRIYDAEAPTRTRKARFATASMLFAYVGEEPPTDPREYRLMGTFSRVLGRVVFPNEVPSGATVWLSAVWINARGEQSVGSAATRFTLQGGLIPARQANSSGRLLAA